MGNTDSRAKPNKRRIGTGFIVTLIALVLVLVGFGGYYFYASSATKDNKDTISELTGQTASLKLQVDSANKEASSLNTQVELLEHGVSSANSRSSSSQGRIESLQKELSNLRSQMSATNAQMADLQSQVKSAETENADLKAILSLSKSSVKANAVTFNLAVDEHVTVAAFHADYTGYLLVSGSTNKAGIIRVNDSFPGYVWAGSPFGFSGTTLQIPILPGDITVKFSIPNNEVGTATFTVTYYY